jgi:hypothetical protein
MATTTASAIRKCGHTRAPKKPADMTPEEKHAHQMATNPAYAAAVQRRAAWCEIRAAYKTGDRSTSDLQSIQTVMDEAADLKARLTAATTIAEFQACVEIADVSLYEKADALEWRDSMASMFITDTRNWTTEAIKWLQGADSVTLCTEDMEEARKWALDALDAFVTAAL